MASGKTTRPGITSYPDTLLRKYAFLQGRKMKQCFTRVGRGEMSSWRERRDFPKQLEVPRWGLFVPGYVRGRGGLEVLKLWAWPESTAHFPLQILLFYCVFHWLASLQPLQKDILGLQDLKCAACECTPTHMQIK